MSNPKRSTCTTDTHPFLPSSAVRAASCHHITCHRPAPRLACSIKRTRRATWLHSGVLIGIFPPPSLQHYCHHARSFRVDALLKGKFVSCIPVRELTIHPFLSPPISLATILAALRNCFTIALPREITPCDPGFLEPR